MRSPSALFPILLLLLTACFAQADTVDLDHALDRVVSNVKFYKLDNGLRVLFYRRGIAPVFNGFLAVRVGGVNELQGETGISHMFEHMAFKGTTTLGTKDYAREKQLLARVEEIVGNSEAGWKLSAEQTKEWQEIEKELKELWDTPSYDREMERRGASGMNATTSKDTTEYFVNLPRSAFEYWTWVESERILSPVMRQFYKERDVVLEERRMRFRDDPSGKLYQLMLSAAYNVHPYRNPVIGFEADIKSLTATSVNQFRSRYYVPGNMVLALVGDVDPERDLELIKRYFGRIPEGPVPEPVSIVEPAPEGERRVTLETRASPDLGVAYRKIQYPHPDDPAIGIMSEILGGGTVSPLYTELVRDKKLAVSANVFEAPGDAFPNLLFFSLSPRAPHSTSELLDAFDDLIARFKAKTVTEEQLKIAKRSISKLYLNALKSNESVAQDLAQSEVLHNNWRASFDWYTQAMSVSAEDVKRVANLYLVRSGRTIGTIESTKQNG